MYAMRKPKNRVARKERYSVRPVSILPNVIAAAPHPPPPECQAHTLRRPVPSPHHPSSTAPPRQPPPKTGQPCLHGPFPLPAPPTPQESHPSDPATPTPTLSPAPAAARPPSSFR